MLSLTMFLANLAFFKKRSSALSKLGLIITIKKSKKRISIQFRKPPPSKFFAKTGKIVLLIVNVKNPRIIDFP